MESTSPSWTGVNLPGKPRSDPGDQPARRKFVLRRGPRLLGWSAGAISGPTRHLPPPKNQGTRRGSLLLGALALVAGLVGPANAKDPAYAAYLRQLQRSLPAPAVPVGDGADLAALWFKGDEDQAAHEVVAVAGQPFAEAVRVRVLKEVTPAYGVQLGGPALTGPIHKGDLVLAVFNVRCLTPETGRYDAYLQLNEAPWTKIAGLVDAPDRSWRRLYVHAVAERDFDAGQAALTLHLGHQAQTLEFGGFAFLNLGPGLDPARLPYTPLTYPGRSKDAPWRKAAQERIERHRKGDLSVLVTRAGRPVAGARVEVRMTRHAYGFGTFVEQPALADTPDGRKYREWTLKLFNRATAPIYWADWGWANERVRQEYHGIARWLQEQHVPTRGHVLVYPGWQFLPAALRELEKDPPALRRRILEHIDEVVEATNPYGFDEYDVTNELRQLHDLTDILGTDAVAGWFAEARKHNRTARLALNENTLFEDGGKTQAEQDQFAKMVQMLLDAKVGPDVLGMQGHFGLAVTAPETVLAVLDRFAHYGKPIHITEFDVDVSDEQGQADYLRDFLTTAFSHPATEAVTQWGFWEGHQWRPRGALLRKDWTLKPNGRAYLDLVFKEWWTNADGRTAEDGSYAVRGFLGDYQVTVRAGGREKVVPVSLPRAGTTVRVVLE
jgi:endo-1,4-beta-xylanase